MNFFNTGTTALATFLALSGCIKSSVNPNSGSPSAKITSVKMRVPSQIGTKDVSGKINGYHLRINKTGGNCAFTDINRTEMIASSETKIDASLKQDCDYELLLSFGRMSTDNSTLEKVYLTSDAHDSKPAKPALVLRDDLKGKSEITIKACVSVTTIGAQELGVNAADCPSVSDNSIGNNPNPSPIQTSSISTNLRLSKTTSATSEGSEVFVSGEITSIAASTKYCAIGLDANFGGSNSKLMVFDEAFVEIKPGSKTSLNKNFSIETSSSEGPLVFSDLLVLEQCFDTKPDTSAKASDLLTKCAASKACPVVKQ